MGTVLTFAPRPKPAPPPAPEPASDLTLRAQIEEAAEVAVDTAQRLIALLDRIDGDADLEDGTDAEPSLAAPENHHGSQVTWLRGNGQDREAEVVAKTPGTQIPPLRWGGNGNILAAAGSVLIGFLERA